MAKEIAKPSAREILKNRSSMESQRANNPWWKARFDWESSVQNAKKYKKDYERTLPEKLSSQAESQMWKRAKQLKDEFTSGMLSREEIHPVKGFLENGTMKWVVDEQRLQANQSVEREQIWLKKNKDKISEFKNLMRHLDPDNPSAGDLERFRPKNRGIR